MSYQIILFRKDLALKSVYSHYAHQSHIDADRYTEIQVFTTIGESHDPPFYGMTMQHDECIEKSDQCVKKDLGRIPPLSSYASNAEGESLSKIIFRVS